MTIDFESLQTEADLFELSGISKAIEDVGINDEILTFIKFNAERVGNLLIHSKSKRKKRNKYFNGLVSILKGDEYTETINDILYCCESSEILFDEVGNFLSSLDISKKSVATQVWSALKLSQSESSYLMSKVNEKMESLRETDSFLVSSNFILENEEGRSYNPDDANNKNVNFASLTLSMIAFNNKLYNHDEEIVVPDETPVEDADLDGTQLVMLNSIYWKDLESASHKCMLFGKKNKIFNKTELSDDYSSKGIEEAFIYDATNDYLYIDSIANERMSRKIHQNQTSMMYESDMLKKVIVDIDEVTNLDDGRFIFHDELPSYITLLEIFCLEEKKINHLFYGLTLREWTRGFATLKYLCDRDGTIRTYSNHEMRGWFSKAGLTDIAIDKFISAITFKKNSKDLYDAPLIKTSGGNYIFYTPAYFSASIVHILLSLFSTYKIDMSEKGLGFERLVLRLLSNKNIRSGGLKFKEGGDEYEYDALFILDNKVFLLECKNTMLSFGSVKTAKRKNQFFHSTAKQVKRLVYGLKKHPSHFNKKFMVNIDDYDIVPVIMNRLPFSWPGEFEGVYISDFSSFDKLLSTPVLTGHTYQKNDESDDYTIDNLKVMHRQWKSDVLTAEDILNHFKMPYQVKEYLDVKKTSEHWIQPSESKVYCHICYEVDYEQLLINQTSVFGLINY